MGSVLTYVQFAVGGSSCYCSLHRDACERGMMEKSAVAEHAWDNHHPIHWEETSGVVCEGGPAHPDDTCGGNVSFTLVLLSHLLVYLKFVHWESSE